MSDEINDKGMSEKTKICSICSRLRDTETSFIKYGWDEGSFTLPEAAGKLIAAESTGSTEREYHHIRRCPECGCYYTYDSNHEYLINGTEDEETLKRITDDEALNIIRSRNRDRK